MLTVLSNRIQINLQINIVMCMLNVLEIMALDKRKQDFSQKIVSGAYSKYNIGCFQRLHAYM